MKFAVEPSATPEEVAAILAALQAAVEAGPAHAPRPSAWRLAGRKYDAKLRPLKALPRKPRRGNG